MVPPLAPESHGAAEALARRLTGDNARHVVSYGTEAGQFQARGWSAVVCGPGDIAQAHQADEYLTVAQFKAGWALHGGSGGGACATEACGLAKAWLRLAGSRPSPPPIRSLPMPPKNRFAELLPEITAWRRDFHENPELLFDVHRTAAKVAALLREFRLR